MAMGDEAPDRVALEAIPALLTERVADVDPKLPTCGVKATAMVHVAPDARGGPLQLSDRAVNCVPARDPTPGLTALELWLVTVNVVGGELVPAVTLP
jgi:hypothetical protein